MKHIFTVLALLLAATAATAAEPPAISLAGTWQFKLDPTSVGEAEKWYEGALPETVKLPGSLDQNNKGTPTPQHIDINDPNVESDVGWLGP